ncbi:hypothetical protein Hesp01_15280 [Herbidospora sp. NBRC 101105]|nr:hypothetical protein Hesp01_15280 [Herbidospora sp. NBRC 101105]
MCAPPGVRVDIPPAGGTMSRQIANGYQQVTLAELEARVRGLETQVAHLTEMLEVLTEERD